MLKRVKSIFGNRARSIIVKSFMQYCTIAIVLLILIVVAVYKWFEHKSLENIGSMMTLVLSDLEYKTTDQFTSTGNLAYQIYSNNNTTELITSSEKDITNEIRVSLNLDNIMITDPYIQSIYICGNSGVLMRKEKNPDDYQLENNQDILNLIYNSSVFTPVPRKIVGKSKTINVYSVIYHPIYPSYQYIDGSVIINIDANYFNNYINSGALNKDTSIFVINNKGLAVADINSSRFLKDLSHERYIQTILKSGESSDSFSVEIGSGNYMVNYIKSSENGLIYVSVDSCKNLVGSLKQTQNFILMVCGIVLTLLVLSYFFLSVRIFRPVKQMVNRIQNYPGMAGELGSGKRADELDYISQTITGMFDHIKMLDRREKDNIYILRNELIRKLLNTRDVFSVDEMQRKYEALGINIDLKKPVSIVLLRVDNFKFIGSESDSNSRSLLLYAIGNITCELLGEQVRCHAFESDEDHEILLVNVPPAEITAFPQFILPSLLNAQEQISRFLHTSVTVTVSDIVTTAADTYKIYRQALGYTRYRLIHGTMKLFYEDIVIKKTVQNYEEDVKSLLVCVKEGNRGLFIHFFDRMLEKARLDFYENFIQALSGLSMSILRIPKDMRLGTEAMRFDAVDFYGRVDGMDGPEELRDYFAEMFDEVCSLLTSANQTVAKSMMGDILNYIGQHFSDSQLSGANIAAHFSISPQYFSKLFTESTGSGFPEYLNHLRLEKAKELLEKTDKSTLEISEAVGYGNRSYFSMLFKKEYGVSPSKFRFQNHKSSD